MVTGHERACGPATSVPRSGLFVGELADYVRHMTATELIEASHAGLDVRQDLTEAMGLAWERLGQAGSGFTGSQRLAIARVVRAALADDDPLPPWVPPSTVDDRAADADLAPHLADAVYRLTLHAKTLTEEWYRDVLSMAELSPLQWVEAIEVVVEVVAIDGFAAAVGLPQPELPAAVPGQPTGSAVGAPSKAARHHWVPIVHLEDDATGMYGGVATVPPVVRALSAVPSSRNTWNRLISSMYMDGAAMADMNWSRGTLDRRQIELLAARLSSLRECFY